MKGELEMASKSSTNRTKKTADQEIKLPVAYTEECYLLGTVIINEQALSRALASRVNEMDFADERNKAIWHTITQMVSNNVPVSLTSLTSELEKENLLKLVPAVYVTKLADTFIYGGDVDHYIKVVKLISNRRLINKMSKDVAVMSGDNTVDFKTLISAIQKLEETALDASDDSDKITDYLDLSFENELKELSSIKTKTNFKFLDELFNNRIYPGLYVLGAISSLGKTTFYAQIADQIAEQGIPVLYFSIEQSQMEIVCKSISRRIMSVYKKRIPSIKIRSNWYPNMDRNASPVYTSGKLAGREVFQPDEIEMINEAFNWYKTNIAPNINVCGSNFSCNVSTLKSKIKAAVSKNKNGQKPVIFVDYLQIIQPEKDFRGTEKQQLDYVMTELERLSKQLQITIFAISSINRVSYTQPISFESFKASGSVEYSADVIIAMDLNAINKLNESSDKTEAHRLLDEEKSKIPRNIQLKILKNRYGRTGLTTYFQYYPDADYFENFDSLPDDGGNVQTYQPDPSTKYKSAKSMR